MRLCCVNYHSTLVSSPTCFRGEDTNDPIFFVSHSVKIVFYQCVKHKRIKDRALVLESEACIQGQLPDQLQGTLQ